MVRRPTMSKLSNFINGLKVVSAMVLIQLSYAAMSVVQKQVLNSHVPSAVFLAFRYAFAALGLIPLALFKERKNRPKLTWSVLFLSFVSGLLGGSLTTNLLFASLDMTSEILVSTMMNLVPVFTFILSKCFRLETISFGTWSGKANIAGIAVSIVGGLLLTFYHGEEIKIWQTRIDLNHHNGINFSRTHNKSTNHVGGFFLSLFASMCSALWYIIQVKINEKYPIAFSSTTMICTMASIQGFVYGLLKERDLSHWHLKLDVMLMIAFSGIVISGWLLVLTTWCIRMRGILFVTIFTPLARIFIAITNHLFHRENLTSESIVGATVIGIGMYLTLWGKYQQDLDDPLRPAEAFAEIDRPEIFFNRQQLESVQEFRVEGADHHDVLSYRIEEDPLTVGTSGLEIEEDH